MEKKSLIKQLKISLKKTSEKKRVRAIRGLAIEADLLSQLSHKNIVDIHGVSEDLANFGMSNNTVALDNNSMNDYFILMERLENTMDRVIWDWKF